LLKKKFLSLNLIKMKQIILVLALIFGTNAVSAQQDVITKHSGEVVIGKVVKLEEYTIVFKYEGEDAENTISKYAVEKIIYGISGRLEEITEKIVINGEEDWNKVVILEDRGYISGLKKGDEVRGKTGLVNFQTGNTGDKKAEKKLKMDAAKLGCQFILLTADKVTVGANSNVIGGSQAIKKGIGYKY
jgi:hypothetical protein